MSMESQRRFRIFLLVIIFTVLFGVSSQANAAPPFYLGYEGLLTDSDDGALTGSYDMTFKIYNSNAGGTALWSETHSDVSVSAGYFSVTLGTTTSLSNLDFTIPLYLGTKVEADAEMSPRQLIHSNAYAQVASTTLSFYATTSAPISPSGGTVYYDTDTGDSYVYDNVESSWKRLAAWATSSNNAYYNEGNVGVGTTTPYAKLSVAGLTAAERFDATTTGATSTFLGGFHVGEGVRFDDLVNCNTIDTDASGYLKCGTDDGGGGGGVQNWGYDTNYGADALTPTTTIPVWIKDALYASSTVTVVATTTLESDLRVDTNTLLVDSFNNRVGIGTTAPYARLSVVGETVSEFFSATSTGATSTFSGGFLVDSGTLTVDYSSNFVGIGTTSPGGSLHIFPNDSVGVTANTAADDLIIENSDGLGAGITLMSEDASNTTIEFTNTSTVGGAVLRWQHNSSTFTLGTQKVGGKISLVSDNGTVAMTIDSNQNIGIGTTSPYAKLSVVGETVSEFFTATSTNATSTFTNTAITNFLDVTSTATSTWANGLNISAGCFAINGTCVGSAVAGNPAGANGSVQYNDGGSFGGGSTLFWDDTQNFLGVGTTSPEATLHVSGGNILQTPTSTTIRLVGTADIEDSNGEELAVVGDYAYVTGDPSTATLQVFDISDPTKPTQLVSYDIEGGANQVIDLEVQNSYAYMIDAFELFTILDVSNPVGPTLVATTSIASATTGSSLDVVGSYAYVTSSTADELQIFNIADPSAITLVGTSSLSAGPTNLEVSGRYAYITDVQGDALDVVDISDPTNHIEIGSVAVGSNPTEMFLEGSYVYIVDETDENLKIVDVSDARTPVVDATLSLPSMDDPYIFVAGRYAYISDDDSDTIRIVDVASSTNPLLLTQKSFTATLPRDLVVRGHYLYLMSRNTPNELQIFDIGGFESTSALIHSLNTSRLYANEDIIANGNITARGANIGASGIFSRGPISAYVSSSTQTNGYSGFFQGNVSIGTTTVNDWALTVQGGVCITAGDGCPASEVAGALRVDTAGVDAGDDDVGDVFDIAELYPASELMRAGEIAALDMEAEGPAVVKRAVAGDRIVGVVSTAPAIAINGSDITIGPEREATSTRPLIALVGRVPVKVNDEGGAIKRGDAIAPSSVSGVGRKANSGEYSVGFALTDWDETNDSVLIFVDPSAGVGSTDLVGGSVVVPDSFMARVKQGAKQVLSDIGIKLKEGVLLLADVVVSRLKVDHAQVNQLELADELNDDIYCFSVRGGRMVMKLGGCDGDGEEMFPNVEIERPEEEEVVPEPIIEEEEETATSTPEIIEEEPIEGEETATTTQEIITQPTEEEQETATSTQETVVEPAEVIEETVEEEETATTTPEIVEEEVIEEEENNEE